MLKVSLNDSVHNKIDIDLMRFIQKNLRYIQDTIIVDEPTGSRQYSNEMQDDECWVWSGFLPQGAHKFVINDPLNDVKLK